MPLALLDDLWLKAGIPVTRDMNRQVTIFAYVTAPYSLLPIRFGDTFLSDRIGISYTRHKIENLTMAQAFDTLSAAHELEASGFKREQAEAIAAVVRAGQGELATKPDLRLLRSEVKQDIVELRGEVKELRSEVKQDIAELRGEVKQDIAELRGENRLLKWMIGLTLTLTLAALSTSIAILLKLLITTN